MTIAAEYSGALFNSVNAERKRLRVDTICGATSFETFVRVMRGETALNLFDLFSATGIIDAFAFSDRLLILGSQNNQTASFAQRIRGNDLRIEFLDDIDEIQSLANPGEFETTFSSFSEILLGRSGAAIDVDHLWERPFFIRTADDHKVSDLKDLCQPILDELSKDETLSHIRDFMNQKLFDASMYPHCRAESNFLFRVLIQISLCEILDGSIVADGPRSIPLLVIKSLRPTFRPIYFASMIKIANKAYRMCQYFVTNEVNEIWPSILSTTVLSKEKFDERIETLMNIRSSLECLRKSMCELQFEIFDEKSSLKKRMRAKSRMETYLNSYSHYVVEKNFDIKRRSADGKAIAEDMRDFAESAGLEIAGEIDISAKFSIMTVIQITKCLILATKRFTIRKRFSGLRSLIIETVEREDLRRYFVQSLGEVGCGEGVVRGDEQYFRLCDILDGVTGRLGKTEVENE